jgi:hypothetical protein
METIIASFIMFSFVTVVTVDAARKRREYLRKQNHT